MLGAQVGVTVHPSQALSSPEAIVRDALAAAKTQLADVLIVDTAGRLAVDDAMMAESNPSRSPGPGGNAVRGRCHDRTRRGEYGQAFADALLNRGRPIEG